MPDANAVDPAWSGYETLIIAAGMLSPPPPRGADVLDLVGVVAAESRRAAGGDSPGMRQRLGIAGALLGYPSAGFSTSGVLTSSNQISSKEEPAHHDARICLTRRACGQDRHEQRTAMGSRQNVELIIIDESEWLGAASLERVRDRDDPTVLS